MRDEIINEYFEWVCGLISDPYSKSDMKYRKLLVRLHETEFRYSIEMDENRAVDGIDLRHRFEYDNGYGDLSDVLTGPCTVLEMMVALALACEEHIMTDPDMGDRTNEWFWGMIVNLNLASMTDAQFNKRIVDEKVSIFLNREYDRDGLGGLFTVPNCDEDLRDVEIWYQLCWYLNSIL